MQVVHTGSHAGSHTGSHAGKSCNVNGITVYLKVVEAKKIGYRKINTGTDSATKTNKLIKF